MDLDKLFEKAQGQPVDYHDKRLLRLDRIRLPKKITYWNVEFIEINGIWKQGIVLKTKGYFRIKGLPKVLNSIVLWQDTAPKELMIEIFSESFELLVYNVWDTGNGAIQNWHNGAAMEIRISNGKRIYFCNDGYPDLQLNDIIFSLSESIID